jgi:hypothetical protein
MPPTVDVLSPSEPSTPAGRAAATDRRGSARLLYLRAFVIGALYCLMVASAVRYGTDLLFDLAVATFWTALIALVWEVGARAIAHVRRQATAG